MGLVAYVSLGLLGCLGAGPFLEVAAQTETFDPCPPNWLRFDGNCYGYFPEKKCWKEAERECQNWDAHLASILSKNETCRLKTYLATFIPDGDVWIGLHNPDKIPDNSFWEWADGLAFNHSQWSLGQPNNYDSRGQFCAELWRSSGFKRWNDEVCTRKNSFLCKYKVEPEDVDCL